MRELQADAEPHSRRASFPREALNVVEQRAPNPFVAPLRQHRQAAEIQKPFVRLVEGEAHGLVCDAGEHSRTARQPPAHGVDRFIVRAARRVEHAFVLLERGPHEV